jgi:uncharacterized protein (DUF362 family)
MRRRADLAGQLFGWDYGRVHVVSGVLGEVSKVGAHPFVVSSSKLDAVLVAKSSGLVNLFSTRNVKRIFLFLLQNHKVFELKR